MIVVMPDRLPAALVQRIAAALLPVALTATPALVGCGDSTAAGAATSANPVSYQTPGTANSAPSAQQPAPSPTPCLPAGIDEATIDAELEGAASRRVTNDLWDDEACTNTLNVMNAQMIENELERICHLPLSEDEQESELIAEGLGKVNFLNSWSPNRQATRQRMALMQNLALDFSRRCLEKELGSDQPQIFVHTAPDAPIDPANSAVTEQLNALFLRIFLEKGEVYPTEIDEARALLEQLQSVATPTDAWAGVMTAWLSSAHFLTY